MVHNVYYNLHDKELYNSITTIHFLTFFGLATVFFDLTITVEVFFAETFFDASPVDFLPAEGFLAIFLTLCFATFLVPFLAAAFLLSVVFFSFWITFFAAAFSACLSLSFSAGETPC